jgi:hypothetical protein
MKSDDSKEFELDEPAAKSRPPSRLANPDY